MTDYILTTDTGTVNATTADNTYFFTHSFTNAPTSGSGFRALGTNKGQKIHFYGSQETFSAVGFKLFATDAGGKEPEGEGDYRMTVYADASIISYNANAIDAWGNDNIITNHGYVSGAFGIYLAGGESKILNTGVIEGQLLGLGVFGNLRGHDVVNSGTISGVENGINLLGEGTFINSGEIYATNRTALISTFSTVVNTGLISSPFVGVSGQGSFTNSGTVIGEVYLTDVKARLFNSGTISDNVYVSHLNDKVLNHGHIASSVYLGAGDDIYRGSGTIEGDLNGFLGDDRFFVRGDVGRVIGGADTDILYTTVTIETVLDVETIILRGDADNHIDVTASTFSSNPTNSLVKGNHADNEITGSYGDDTLKGRGGDDTLIGGAGKDTLVGGLGNDILEGGGGKDSLSGGGGADVFLFAHQSSLSDKRNATDMILDIGGADVIDLSGIAEFDFIGASAFSASGTAELRHVTVEGNGVLQLDVNGDGTKDVLLVVEGVTNFTVDDFIL